MTAPMTRPETAVPTDEVIARVPMSFEEFLVWDHEGGLTEWVDGAAQIYMPATELHQRVVEFLLELLRGFVRLHAGGRVIGAPYAMRALPGGPAREPDIMFIAAEHRAWLGRTFLNGPADLVIEAVSEDSPRRDSTEKFAEYQSAGVHEYWLIDARDGRQRADFYVSDAANQFQRIPMQSDGTYHSTVLPGLWLRLEWLWAEDVDAWAALGEIVGMARLMEAMRRRMPPP